MAKLIKKKDCKYDHGYIVQKNKIIGIPWNVYAQLNKLEVMIQEWEYLKAQPSYNPGPSLDGFERRRAFDNKRPYVDLPDTPTVDKRVNEAMAFMAEVDATNYAVETNEYIDQFGALVDWCDSKKFVEGDCVQQIDLAELGNPLELSGKDIAKILNIMVTTPVNFGE